MERLTARTEKGLAYLVNVKPDEQVVESPYKNTLQCILDCFDRLAAYEDTGFTPEEVNACKHALMGREIAKITEFEGISLDRLEEICEAERDGRLVLMPCKVGEYWARDGKRYIVAEIAMTNAWGVMVRHYAEGDGKMLSCNPQYFAKHYTRAEAEAALKERE